MAKEWTPWTVHPPSGVRIELEDNNGKLFFGRWYPELGDAVAWMGSENYLMGPSEIISWRLANERDC